MSSPDIRCWSRVVMVWRWDGGDGADAAMGRPLLTARRRSGASAVKGGRRLVSVGRRKVRSPFGFLPPQIPLISVAGHCNFDTADWKRIVTLTPAMAWRGDGGDGAGAAMGRQRPADGAVKEGHRLVSVGRRNATSS
ncbi:hypothetical protein TIFTF001_025815 [Ficus carica]|uniref:Uncharacterized protein n=1 Tax=Ficus carica TaxID=3494 RepID=A0AA88ANJ9_FICCA|nr:hypothetical protein TIFTF001_025815 [Ficus carica]